MKLGERLAACGWRAVAPGGHVGLRCSDGVAGYSGLSTCGSVWACPVCSAKILGRRSDELAELLDHVNRRGGSVGMLTLTMRHRAGQSLKTLWDALSAAWSAARTGRPFRRLAARLGLVGWVRAVEVTCGPNGWHVHVHALLIYDGPVSEAAGEQLAGAMWDRWLKALERRGLDALRSFADGGGGVDYRASWSAASQWAADYVTKSTANEATLGPLKKGRGENRTPFEVAQTFAATGDADDLALWQEWERSSHGRRQITYSQGLREWAELGAEQSDEEIAGEELGSEDLLFLTPEAWRAIRAMGWELLDVVEAGGLPAARAWLEARGLDYVLPPKRPRTSDPAVILTRR